MNGIAIFFLALVALAALGIVCVTVYAITVQLVEAIPRKKRPSIGSREWREALGYEGDENV